VVVGLEASDLSGGAIAHQRWEKARATSQKGKLPGATIEQSCQNGVSGVMENYGDAIEAGAGLFGWCDHTGDSDFTNR
jgi:hypothetical protein